MNYPKPIYKAIGNLRSRIQRVKADAPVVADLLKVVTTCDLRTDYSSEGKWASVSVSYDTGSIQGPLLLIHEVRDISEALEALRALRRLGYRVKSHDDYPELRARTYLLHKPPEERVVATLRVCLTWQDGAVCQYVQIGTEEKPVYELQCGGVTVSDDMGGA